MKTAAAANTPAPGARRRGSASPTRAGTTATDADRRPDGLRAGSKMAEMLDMALRPQGATEAEICKKLGWKKCRVTLKRTCEKVGAVLTQSRPRGPGTPIVYSAAFPKAKKK